VLRVRCAVGAAFLAVMLASAFALVGASGAPSAPAAPSASRHLSTKYLLAHLTVRAPHMTGYVRSKFKLWDSHPGGCNTRYEVLIRDAKRKPHVGAGCFLTHGRWLSPYDSIVTTNPTDEQIDHVVPLEQAWSAGAWRWSASTREQFANDLGTSYDLLAVSAHSNESKGDRGPDQYLPPKTTFDCRYMADYTAILWRWQLTIDLPEKSFLHKHLRTCGWPTVAEPARPTIHRGSTTSPTPTPTPTPISTHSCTLTSTGNCIKAGEFCPKADYGQTGYDANGDPLTCTGDAAHPRWENT
jgi:hypothetical protein